jgi:hypothetical protein
MSLGALEVGCGCGKLVQSELGKVVARIKKEKVVSFMKLQNIAGLGVLMSAAIGMLGASSAQAQIYMATGSSSGAAVDAQATFTYDSTANTLTIVLVNLEQNTGQSGQAISGLLFDGLTTGAPLFGTGQLMTVTQNAAPVFGADTAGDLTHWAYSSGGGITTLSGGQPDQMIFGTPGADGKYHLNGNGMGVENFDPYVYLSGTFVISNATVTAISDVKFVFGTPDATITGTPVPPSVPEASTVFAGALMLLPLGVGAIRALRKEKALEPAKVS